MKISQNQYFDFAFVCGSGRAEDGCGEDGYAGRSGYHGDDGGGVGCGDSTSLQVTKSLHQLFCLHYVLPPAVTTHNTTWRSPPEATHITRQLKDLGFPNYPPSLF